MKNHDFTPKKIIFSNFRGGGRSVAITSFINKGIDSPTIIRSMAPTTVISNGVGPYCPDFFVQNE